MSAEAPPPSKRARIMEEKKKRVVAFIGQTGQGTSAVLSRIVESLKESGEKFTLPSRTVWDAKSKTKVPIEIKGGCDLSVQVEFMEKDEIDATLQLLDQVSDSDEDDSRDETWRGLAGKKIITSPNKLEKFLTQQDTPFVKQMVCLIHISPLSL